MVPRKQVGGACPCFPWPAASILGGSRSRRSLAIRLGVDEVGLKGNDAGSQMVTLWKRLSDRPYVAYEQGIVAAATILKLDFSLTRQLVLRVEAGETSALGIFFRRSFD
jgi:translocation and assembly module TamB